MPLVGHVRSEKDVACFLAYISHDSVTDIFLATAYLNHSVNAYAGFQTSLSSNIVVTVYI